MQAERLPDGRIRIPVRVEWQGGAIGEGVEVVGPDDPRFSAWDDYLRGSGLDDYGAPSDR